MERRSKSSAFKLRSGNKSPMKDKKGFDIAAKKAGLPMETKKTS